MKKLFVSAVLALVVAASSFAADITKVDQRVLAAFEKEFTSATNVSWEVLKSEDIFHASFVYGNDIMEAYYSTEGELIAAARHISSEKLPLLVAKSLRENFGSYQFRQASEYISSSVTSYIVTVDNEKSTLILRIYNNGKPEVLKRTKK